MLKSNDDFERNCFARWQPLPDKYFKGCKHNFENFLPLELIFFMAYILALKHSQLLLIAWIVSKDINFKEIFIAMLQEDATKISHAI